MAPITWTQETAATYLAAMIDGEGHVFCRPHPPEHGGYTRGVTITNTDVDLIASTLETCAEVGIKRIALHVETRHHKKPVMVLRFGGVDNMTTLRDRVPIQSGRKRAVVDEAIATYRPPGKGTVCAKGHRRTTETTYWNNGNQHCRICRLEAQRARTKAAQHG